MLRKMPIGFAILFLLLVGAGVYLYLKVQPILREAEARQRMLQPRPIKGEGNFERSAFYTGESLGDTSQIRVGWPADREGAAIAVVGAQGAHFVDSAGQLKKSVRFSIEERCPVAMVRIDATRGYGYLTRDESWAVPATLFDKEGQVRWRSKSWPGIDDSVSGDVNGDGKLSVVIGFNGAEASSFSMGKAKNCGRRRRATSGTWRHWIRMETGARRYSIATPKANYSYGTETGM
jgi:hypothetical protein